MRDRAAALREDLKAEGLSILDADCPVRLGGKPPGVKSVDTRIWSARHQSEALVEVKWTRTRMERALTFGMLSYPKLKVACREGRWARSGHAVKAALVGVLVVMPGSWTCMLASAEGPGRTRFPVAAKKRRGGKSLSGAEKGKREVYLKSLDKVWRKTAGKEMSARHRNEYRKTAGGKAIRARSNKKFYAARK